MRSLMYFLNSHFGSNFSVMESDLSKKDINFVSQWYEDYIESDFKASPFVEYREPDAIPTIDISELTQEKFIQLTENFTHPIVVKNFMTDSIPVKEWNLDFLKNNCGEVRFPALKNHSDKKYTISNVGEYQYIEMKDFIDQVKRGEKLYMNNITSIFGHHPELLEDLELEKLEKYTGVNVKDGTNITNMFLGSYGTGTSFHCSISGNFFYNIKGHKKWILTHPQYTQYLKPLPSRTGLFCVSKLDFCNAEPGDYPLNVPRYEVVLDEGDMLFNPPWWWHGVINKSEYTLACANRFTNFTSAFTNSPLLSSIFFSHPISNYMSFANVTTKEEANKKWDEAIVKDLLNKDKI